MATAAKILPEEEIRARYLKGLSTVDELAKEFGTFRSRIRRICGVEPEDKPESAVDDGTGPEPGPETFYTISIDLTEGALDDHIARFTPQEKAIALEAVLCSRIG